VASRAWDLGRLVVAAIFLLPAAVLPSDDADLLQEVVFFCHYHMGEFGVEAVRACVDRDLTAAKALEAYPVQAQKIVARCAETLRGSGWSMVKACADRDLEAAAALEAYAGAHQALLERCRATMEQRGPAAVKACVDRELAPEARGND
jgi:hypothetical protein